MSNHEYYRVRLELLTGEYEETRYFSWEWMEMLKYISNNLYSGGRVIEIKLMNYHMKEGDSH